MLTPLSEWCNLDSLDIMGPDKGVPRTAVIIR